MDKDQLIKNLTEDELYLLKSIHAEQYSGSDEDMADDFQKWLHANTIMDLEAYLE